MSAERTFKKPEMTVQELIDRLMRVEDKSVSALWDGYHGSETIDYVIDESTDDTGVVFIGTDMKEDDPR